MNTLKELRDKKEEAFKTWWEFRNYSKQQDKIYHDEWVAAKKNYEKTKYSLESQSRLDDLIKFCQTGKYPKR